MTRHLIALFVALTVLSPVSVVAAEKTKVVLIAGQVSHPSGQHEFNAGCIILARPTRGNLHGDFLYQR